MIEQPKTGVLQRRQSRSVGFCLDIYEEHGCLCQQRVHGKIRLSICAYGYRSGGEGELGSDHRGSSGAKTLVGSLESLMAYEDSYTCRTSSSKLASGIPERGQLIGSESPSRLLDVSSAAVVWPTEDVVI